MRISVIAASRGRPDELGRLLDALKTQSLAPTQIVLSLTGESDAPAQLEGCDCVFGPAGSSIQRNRGLERVEPSAQLVAFLDDDYRPAVQALEGMACLFAAHPDVVGANGRLLADGINSPGISEAHAAELLALAPMLDLASCRPLGDLEGLYGCNMVFRADAVKSLRFDEALPLYGWQEDFDFAARLHGCGRIVGSNAFYGVHLGVKRARTSGLRFGYSQVANPLYLVGKGTMSKAHAARLVSANILANIARSLHPEPWVDRRGRLAGNWLALSDLVARRMRPDRVFRLPG